MDQALVGLMVFLFSLGWLQALRQMLRQPPGAAVPVPASDPATWAAVAWPGTSGQVIDLEGLVIRHFVHCGSEFIVNLSGGAGRWRRGGDMVEVQDISEMELRFGYGSRATEATVREAVWRLERWSRAGTPLRFVGARDHMSLLLEAGGALLAVPNGNRAHAGLP